MDSTVPPKPQAPICPDAADCCDSGCSPCIFDFYQEELERYREELKAWQERYGTADAGTSSSP